MPGRSYFEIQGTISFRDNAAITSLQHCSHWHIKIIQGGGGHVNYTGPQRFSMDTLK